MRLHILLTGLITGVLAIHVFFMWMEISSCNAIQEELAVPDSSRKQKIPEKQYSPVAPQLIPFSWILLYTTGKRKTTTAANGGRPLAAGRYAAVHELDINYNLTKQMYWGLCDGDTSRN